MPIVSARMHFTRVKGSEIRSSFLGYLKGVHVRTKGNRCRGLTLQNCYPARFGGADRFITERHQLLADVFRSQRQIETDLRNLMEFPSDRFHRIV